MDVPGKRTNTDDELASLDKLCELCKVDNVDTQASCFCKECEQCMCKTCFEQHIRATLCRHHTLLDIKASSETCLRRNASAIKCKQHEAETVKYYCRAHEAVGCGDCIVSKHNGCKTQFIKDVSDNFQQSVNYKTVMKKLEKQICDTKEVEKKIKENKMDNQIMFEKALRNVSQLRLNINEYLDKDETDITCQVKTVMEENNALLIKLVNDCKMLLIKLEEIKNTLNSELYNDDVLFIHTVECKPKFSESEKAISDMKSKSTKKYEFICDEELLSLETSSRKLGTLAISNSAFFPTTKSIKEKVEASCTDGTGKAKETAEKEEGGASKEQQYVYTQSDLSREMRPKFLVGQGQSVCPQIKSRTSLAIEEPVRNKMEHKPPYCHDIVSTLKPSWTDGVVKARQTAEKKESYAVNKQYESRSNVSSRGYISPTARSKYQDGLGTNLRQESKSSREVRPKFLVGQGQSVCPQSYSSCKDMIKSEESLKSNFNPEIVNSSAAVGDIAIHNLLSGELGIGTVTAVHRCIEVSVKWEDGEIGRHRVGVGQEDVTLLH